MSFPSKRIQPAHPTLKPPFSTQNGSYAHTWVGLPPLTAPLLCFLHFYLLYRKGISGSSIPYSRRAPSWLKINPDETQDLIIRLAKKGLTPSQVGVILRDSHGIGQVRNLTGNKIVRILRAQGLAPEIPEDIYHLIKKALAVRKHLERNRKDKDGKYRLILIESRIHRLARYYKRTGQLPSVWKYEAASASALVA